MRKTLMVGLVAAAVVLTVLAPCRCVFEATSCHGAVQEPADAHRCCDKPAGIQAVQDSCCDEARDVVVTSTDAPGVTPVSQKGAPVASGTTPTGLRFLAHTPPPVRTDRHTILLI